MSVRAQMETFQLDLSGLDQPDGQIDGRSFYDLRCRVPFSIPANPVARGVSGEDRLVDDAARGDDDGGEGGQRESDGGEERQGGEIEVIEGIASSTSVDWYGTRMHREALEMMAAQFRNGVAYIPRHGSIFESVEWDQVIGRTREAKVERAQVAEPREANEDQFVLRVQIALYMDEPLAQGLVRRLRRGEQIGQSIGGWFTALRVITDEEGEVTDIIVMGVELDHLAVTRSPANPDSDKLVIAMRQKVADAMRSRQLDAFADRVEQIGADLEASGTAARMADLESFEDMVASLNAARSEVAQHEAQFRTMLAESGPIVDVVDDGDHVVVRFGKTPQATRGTEPEAEPEADAPAQGQRVQEAARAEVGGDVPPAKRPEVSVERQEPESGPEPATTTEHEIETHEQIQPMCSLNVAEAEGRVTLSFRGDESPENIQAAARAILAGEHGDAMRTALREARAVAPPAEASAEASSAMPEPPEQRTTTAGDPGTIEGEIDMDPQVLQELIRSAVSEGVSQGVQAALAAQAPQPTGDPTTTTQSQQPQAQPATHAQPQPATHAAPQVQPLPAHRQTPIAEGTPPASEMDALRSELKRWQARAERSEGMIAEMAARPVRSGIAAHGMTRQQIPAGFGAEDSWKGLAARSREEGFTALPAVIDRAAETLADEKIAKRGTHHLTMMLAQGLNAAEADGLLVDPATRASWAG